MEECEAQEDVGVVCVCVWGGGGPFLPVFCMSV